MSSRAEEKEFVRQLRKQLGDKAAEAVQRCMDLAAGLNAQQQLLAIRMGELEALHDRTAARVKRVDEFEIDKLVTRLDALALWCDKNEQAITEATELVAEVAGRTSDHIMQLRVDVDREQRPWWRRSAWWLALRGLLTGSRHR